MKWVVLTRVMFSLWVRAAECHLTMSRSLERPLSSVLAYLKGYKVTNKSLQPSILATDVTLTGRYVRDR